MNNVIDYLKWRGDLRFSQAGPGPVDMLIFAQLVHAPLERLEGGGQEQTLSRLRQAVYPAPPDRGENVLVRSRFELWENAEQCARYGGVMLKRFAAHFEPEAEKQFAAALFGLETGEGVVCFRGTDATLVGWKEDFNLAFESPIPSQLEAVNFMNKAAEVFPALNVCGHSKGGNLALYAASMCAPEVREKIVKVYSFDGPGLDEETLKGPGYRAVCPRICSYIPESSIIGLLLGYHDGFTVVRSDSVSLWQHNPYYWHVLGPDFVAADGTTRTSRFTDLTLHAFLNDCPPEERRVLVDTLFGILNVTGARTLRELPRGVALHMDEIASALGNVPPASRRALVRTLKELAGAGAENLRVLLGDAPDSN